MIFPIFSPLAAFLRKARGVSPKESLQNFFNFLFLFSLFKISSQRLEDHVKPRDQEDTDKRTDQHTSGRRRTDRTITQGTGSRGDRQRDQAADKSEGGH